MQRNQRVNLAITFSPLSPSWPQAPFIPLSPCNRYKRSISNKLNIVEHPQLLIVLIFIFFLKTWREEKQRNKKPLPNITQATFKKAKATVTIYKTILWYPYETGKIKAWLKKKIGTSVQIFIFYEIWCKLTCRDLTSLVR